MKIKEFGPEGSVPGIPLGTASENHTLRKDQYFIKKTTYLSKFSIRVLTSMGCSCSDKLPKEATNLLAISMSLETNDVKRMWH